MKSTPIVTVAKVHKSFVLPHERHSSLKSAVLHLGRRSYEKFEVLKGVDFTVGRGEFFGIVGKNGSGKSTLLKLLAQIYAPTKGKIAVHGNLTPFIELGVGFNPELTGKENVYLNGAILGLTTKEIDECYDDIVAFAELERFMDQKLKNYSSGMQVRLAFSIAIQAHNEILLIDEVLAVGDSAFQRKCFNVFKQIKQSGKTVIFVSHDMNAIQEYCDRAILVHEGEIIAEGKPRMVALEYNRINLEAEEKQLSKAEGKDAEMVYGDGSAQILSVWTENEKGEKRNAFSPFDTHITAVFTIKALKDLSHPVVGMIFQNSLDQIVFATNSKVREVQVPSLKAGQEIMVRYRFENIYTDDRFTISGAISSSGLDKVYSRIEKAHVFSVGGRQMRHAMAHPDTSIAVKIS